VLEPSFWLSGVLKKYVCYWSSWLTGASSLSAVVPLSSIMHAFQSAVSCFRSALRVFRIIFSKVPSTYLSQFAFENSVSILCTPYSLYWYKLLITALSLLPNSMLQCWYFVITLITIIHNNVICLCSQTPVT